ncbi:hypothetical protein TeGR_g1050, partial [Tetraparma gracilis]
MAFGSSPGVDCLPLSTDPNSFLRDPSTSSIGDCALAQWDDFEVETSAVNAHNEELLAAAKNATNSTSGAEDLSVEAPADSYPAWRLPAIVGLLLIKIAAVLFGDALTKKKTGGGDMAAVAPVWWVEIMCLHGVSFMSVRFAFHSAVYWRPMVARMVEIKEGTVDPLANFDRVPSIKNIVRLYRENFAIDTSGKYSLVLVIISELVEFATQAYNAHQLAKFLDWRYLLIYGNLILGNFVIFGICLILPERFVGTSAMIGVDGLTDAFYIIFGIS